MATTPQNITVDPAAAGTGALALTLELISLLANKNIITQDEGQGLYREALAKMHVPEQRQNLRDVIKAIVPGAQI